MGTILVHHLFRGIAKHPPFKRRIDNPRPLDIPFPGGCAYTKRGERFIVYSSWMVVKIGDFRNKNNITKNALRTLLSYSILIGRKTIRFAKEYIFSIISKFWWIFMYIYLTALSFKRFLYSQTQIYFYLFRKFRVSPYLVRNLCHSERSEVSLSLYMPYSDKWWITFFRRRLRRFLFRPCHSERSEASPPLWLYFSVKIRRCFERS